MFVPATWLQDAPASLRKVIAVASAVGASPEASELKVVDAGAAISPDAPWLAFGVAPSGVDVAGLKDGHLLIGGKPQPLLDVSGLDRAAVVQVGTSGGQLGVLYSDLGAQAPSFGAPFRLLRGDLAVLDGSDAVREFDRQDPYGGRVAQDGNPQSKWERHMVWLLLLVGVIVFALLAARVTQVRRRKSANTGH